MSVPLEKTFPPEEIYREYAKSVDNMGLPSWVFDHQCSECGADFESSFIRSISINTNPQHVGNVSVGVLCTKCKAGYELHFQKAASNIDEFVDILHDEVDMPVPVPDYKIPNEVNNLIEHMVSKKKQGETQ